MGRGRKRLLDQVRDAVRVKHYLFRFSRLTIPHNLGTLPLFFNLSFLAIPPSWARYRALLRQPNSGIVLEDIELFRESFEQL